MAWTCSKDGVRKKYKIKDQKEEEEKVDLE
jgi:hypothetical protein